MFSMPLSLSRAFLFLSWPFYLILSRSPDTLCSWWNPKRSHQIPVDETWYRHHSGLMGKEMKRKRDGLEGAGIEEWIRKGEKDLRSSQRKGARNKGLAEGGGQRQRRVGYMARKNKACSIPMSLNAIGCTMIWAAVHLLDERGVLGVLVKTAAGRVRGRPGCRARAGGEPQLRWRTNLMKSLINVGFYEMDRAGGTR